MLILEIRDAVARSRNREHNSHLLALYQKIKILNIKKPASRPKSKCGEMQYPKGLKSKRGKPPSVQGLLAGTNEPIAVAEVAVEPIEVEHPPLANPVEVGHPAVTVTIDQLG